jgi:hypothetical protein
VHCSHRRYAHGLLLPMMAVEARSEYKMERERMASSSERLFSRRLADGRRIEVLDMTGEVVTRIISANGRLLASHLCSSVGDAIEAASHWDGSGYPFAERRERSVGLS